MGTNKEEAARWLEFASEDLASARALLDAHATPRNAAYLAQQAVEKAIKACFVRENLPFARSHSLEFLRNSLAGQWSWKGKAADLSSLTEYAIEARYPGDWDEITAEEAAAALVLAEETLELIRMDLVL